MKCFVYITEADAVIDIFSRIVTSKDSSAGLSSLFMCDRFLSA